MEGMISKVLKLVKPRLADQKATGLEDKWKFAKCEGFKGGTSW